MKTMKKAFLPLLLALAMLAMVAAVSAANPSVGTRTVVKATVADTVYNGKKQPVKKVKATLSDGRTVTVSSTYFNAKYNKTPKNAGTYQVTFTFKGTYQGTVSKVPYKITKRAAVVSLKKKFHVAKKADDFYCGVKIADPNGKVTASVPSGLKKKTIISKNNHKLYQITVKKGFKGTKKIVFKISGTNNITTKSVTYTVKSTDGKVVTVTKSVK